MERKDLKKLAMEIGRINGYKNPRRPISNPTEAAEKHFNKTLERFEAHWNSRAKARNSMYLTKYGITKQRRDEMARESGNRQASCGSTGKVRGMLCAMLVSDTSGMM